MRVLTVSREGDTYVDGGDDGEEDEPEPDEDVDLLVDDVERQDAETVDGLDCARGAVLVERALRHLGTSFQIFV